MESSNSPSDIPTQASQHIPREFILDFSPDEKLVAVTRKLGKKITILDPKSNHMHFAVDAGMEVYTVRIMESTMIACGLGGKIITWDLPVGNYASNIREDIQNSVKTNAFEHLISPGMEISTSPDLNHVATVIEGVGCVDLHPYSINTGEALAVDTHRSIPCPCYLLPEEFHPYGRQPTLWHTPDGSGIRYALDEKTLLGWKIVKDRESNITRLEYLQPTECPPGGLLWCSSHGYQAEGDGWILSPNKKRLLWLPHHWQSDKMTRRWSGKFLALRHHGLPEAVILEMEVDN